MAPLKSLLLGASLATLALSTPLATDAENLYARQFGTGSTANELEQGSCKDVTLIFARGSTELGNMVCLLPAFTRTILSQNIPSTTSQNMWSQELISGGDDMM